MSRKCRSPYQRAVALCRSFQNPPFDPGAPGLGTVRQFADALFGVIAAFAARMLRGRPPVIFGDGRQSRDFVFVDDIIKANLLAAEVSAVHGEVVNIGTGRATDLKTMAAAFNRVLGTNFEPVHDAPRPGDVKHSLADISAARALLGYEPEVAFEEGLRQTIDWYRWALETGYGGWSAR